MTLENSTSTVDYVINTTCINITCTEYAEMTGLKSGEKRAFPAMDEEESEIDGMMVFGFVVMALTGVLIVVGVSLYVNKIRKRSSDELPLYSLARPQKKSVIISRASQIKKFHYESNPIFVQNLKKRIGALIEDENDVLVREFESINHFTPEFSSVAGSNPKNRRRNRYQNIVPYDYNRVKLTAADNDYINASFVTGHSFDREYIICQGPTNVTADHHWRMIFENNVIEIVQLTQFVEVGHPKCHPYWIDKVGERTETDEFEVETVQLKNVQDIYSIATLQVKDLVAGENRMVSVYLYTAWPDHDVPQSPDNLLSLIYAFRRVVRNNAASPIVVHCSAGVGRSATFIALDIALQQLATKETVDVLNSLHRLRMQRCFAVQTLEQYQLIYSSILHHFNNILQ